MTGPIHSEPPQTATVSHVRSFDRDASTFRVFHENAVTESFGNMLSQLPFPGDRTPLPIDRPLGRAVKRALDIAISLPVVTMVLPVLCVIVKITHLLQSSGPLFYRQVRSGLRNQEFVILKFRTMHVPPPGVSDIDSDPHHRIFALGQLLRFSKIDEIPQFLNVLLGDMSVVGPRPHHFEDCRKWEQEHEHYALRRLAKPGITGLAQYREYCGAFEWSCVRNRVERDLVYINSWSIWLDIELILKTAVVILRNVTLTFAQRFRGFVSARESEFHDAQVLEMPVNVRPRRAQDSDEGQDRIAA
ncbi:MAG: sugar transferase [Planctomycetaceae bacterium]|nr:sugar transferase [Planctomycetaceae bacterium]